MVTRLLHLVGSPVSDFWCDLSRLYAADCIDSIADAVDYENHIAYITPDGQWRFPEDLSPGGLAASDPVPAAEAVGPLAALGVDAAVPQMFCRPGLTTYRSLLDLLRIPYLGNTVDAMALTLNKARARAVVAAAGVRVPEAEVLRPGDPPSIEPPAVVKPVDADNSWGVSFVGHRSEYDAALASGFAHSAEVLVERYVELGREVRCGLLVQGDKLVCLPLEEYRLDPTTRPIRRVGDKLDRAPNGELKLVAKDSSRAWIVEVDDPVTEPVWEAARACHVALGCRHYSLFDFRVDPEGRPWFLEAGLYCSFARQSVISVMAAAAGIDNPELFRRVLRGVVA